MSQFPSLPSCCIPFGSILNSWSHARHCASVMLVGTSVIISRSSRSRWGSRTSDKRDSAAPSASPEPGWSARRSRAASSTGAIAGSMVRWSAFILSTSGAASGLHCTTGIEPTVLGPVVMVKEIHHPQHVVGESHSVGLLPCLRRGGDLDAEEVAAEGGVRDSHDSGIGGSVGIGGVSVDGGCSQCRSGMDREQDPPAAAVHTDDSHTRCRGYYLSQ